jgi:prevent-host-death family protein
MKDNIWQLQEAKSKFSQLVEAAIRNKPQFVTKHGDNAVVVLSFEDYKKMIKPQTDIVTFLRNSPLTEVDLTTLRNTDYPRNIEL